MGGVGEDRGGKYAMIHSHCKLLQMPKTIPTILSLSKARNQEKWPTGNVPRRQKEPMFALQGDSSQTFSKERDYEVILGKVTSYPHRKMHN